MKQRSVWVILVIGTATGTTLGAFTPGDLASVGLTRIVDDTTAGDIGGHYGMDAYGDVWEPYSSVLGNSVFLFESNTFAESSPGVAYSNMMRYAVALQPVAGGAYGAGEVFFADDGTAYKGPISSRQTGAPGRVAGDKRPGARYFMTGGEARPHYYPSVFGTMPAGPTYIDGSRYGTVQLYSLDITALTQTMKSQAFDVLQGVSGTPAVLDDVSRFGGELAALSNGNFLAVVYDQSQLVVPQKYTPTAMIVKPDGTVVRPAFSIGGPSWWPAWSNVAAFKGGFAIRCPMCQDYGVTGIIRFYDNDGNFQGMVPMNDPNLKDSLGRSLSFLTTERGDYDRIASHVNSPYLFLAGHTTGGQAGIDKTLVVTLAVWDTRTRTYVGQANVTEMTAAHGGVGSDTDDFAENWADTDRPRVNLAVDALNRVCVVFDRGVDTGNQLTHVAARVLAFNSGTGTFAHLTHSFWAFINYCGDAYGDCWAINTRMATVSMTTRQILIGAKGGINLSNRPDLGANSPYLVNLYTVISHPDPQNDPTCPAIFGDTDADGDVDSDDLGQFASCSKGPGIAHAASTMCSCLDADGDTDVDVVDFGLFQRCISTASAVPADPACHDAP